MNGTLQKFKVNQYFLSTREQTTGCKHGRTSESQSYKVVFTININRGPLRADVLGDGWEEWGCRMLCTYCVSALCQVLGTPHRVGKRME